jgi:hypothetical protein
VETNLEAIPAAIAAAARAVGLIVRGELPVGPRHTLAVDGAGLSIEAILIISGDAPLLDHEELVVVLGSLQLVREEAGPEIGSANIAVDAQDVNGIASDDLVDEVVTVRLVAANATGGDLNRRVTHDLPHGLSTTAEPVARVILRSQRVGLLERLVLEVECQNSLAPLAPSLTRGGRLVGQDVVVASINTGDGLRAGVVVATGVGGIGIVGGKLVAVDIAAVVAESVAVMRGDDGLDSLVDQLGEHLVQGFENTRVVITNGARLKIVNVGDDVAALLAARADTSDPQADHLGTVVCKSIDVGILIRVGQAMEEVKVGTTPRVRSSSSRISATDAPRTSNLGGDRPSLTLVNDSRIDARNRQRGGKERGGKLHDRKLVERAINARKERINWIGRKRKKKLKRMVGEETMVGPTWWRLLYSRFVSRWYFVW